MDTTIYLIIFLPLILYLISQRRNQKLMAHQIMSRKKGRTQMLELAKKFIDKKCIIYTFDHSQIVGILRQVSDSGVLQQIVDQVVAANEKSVNDYRGGKTNALGYLVGQCMKASKGKGNPAIMREMLLKILNG